MRPPAFNPPYDSPIEEIFACEFVKYANKSVDLIAQYNTPTICGNFIIDFIAILENGRTIGIECDGKEFHDQGRDEWRDAMILGDTKVDSIYRFRGQDIFHKIHDCFYLMLKIDPALFSERGAINIYARASDLIKDKIIDPTEELFSVFVAESDHEPFCHLKVARLHKLSTPYPRTFWKEAYKYAKSTGGGNLDNTIKSFVQCCGKAT